MKPEQIITQLEARYDEVAALPEGVQLGVLYAAVANRFVGYVKQHSLLWRHFESKAHFCRMRAGGWRDDPAFLAALGEAVKALRSARKRILGKYNEALLKRVATVHQMDRMGCLKSRLTPDEKSRKDAIEREGWESWCGPVPLPGLSIEKNLKALEDEGRYRDEDKTCLYGPGVGGERLHHVTQEFRRAMGMYGFFTSAIATIGGDESSVAGIAESLEAEFRKLKDAVIDEPQRMGCSQYDDVWWACRLNDPTSPIAKINFAPTMRPHESRIKLMASLRAVKNDLVEVLLRQGEGAVAGGEAKLDQYVLWCGNKSLSFQRGRAVNYAYRLCHELLPEPTHPNKTGVYSSLPIATVAMRLGFCASAQKCDQTVERKVRKSAVDALQKRLNHGQKGNPFPLEVRCRGKNVELAARKISKNGQNTA